MTRDSPYAGTLHIIAQSYYHTPACIVGTHDALAALRQAIDAALSDGSGCVRTFASDGEGYRIGVVRVSEEEMETVPYGYTDTEVCGEMAPWTQRMRDAIDGK